MYDDGYVTDEAHLLASIDRKLDAALAAQAAVIRPGDHLLLGFARHVSPDEARRISETVGGLLGGLDVTVIDQLSHMAVYRTEAS